MSDEPTDPPRPPRRPSPRRGALPTPASEIERATPYAPASEDDTEASASEQDPDDPEDPRTSSAG